MLAALAVLSLVAAACGGDDDDGGDSSSAADVDPAGILRLPIDMTAPTFGQLDPTKAVAALGILQTYFLGSLLKLNSEGEIEPSLAREVEVVDASNLVVRLRPGLTFTDGTPLDAEALKFSWERTVREAQPGAIEAEFREFQTLTVTSPTEMEVTLKTPIAGAFYRLMRLAESSPVSPTAVRSGADFNANPVGAGPFKLKRFQAGQALELEKNPTYWDADNVKLAGIEYVNVTPQSTGNAVRTSVIDFINLSAPEARAVEGVSGWDIVVEPSNGVQ
ncbi:MAG: ABC transporter substrate-binding protein, partial [Acidimicrobiia bacterium]